MAEYNLNKTTMEKVKIVRIITRLNIGGPAIHAILLTKGLNNNRFKTILVTGKVDKKEGDMSYLASENGLEEDIRVMPHMKRPISLINDLRAFYNLFILLRKERPLIVHTHTAKAGFLGRLAALMAGVPITIHSFHGHIFYSYFNPLKTKTFLAIEKIFSRFTDQIIVVSDTIKEDICTRFKVADKTKTSVIGLGLDLDNFEYASKLRGFFRKELGIAEDTLLVGIVGRLTAVKNHRLLLDTVKVLKKKTLNFNNLNVKFLIIGDGELRPMLENYATNLGIGERISFVGWQRDMPRVYADLDILVLTSLNEGTPVSIIEAMACQKAVVATAVGGVPDLIIDGETGFLVQRDDAEGFANALYILIKDKESRERLGRNAAEFIRNRFSKNRLINDIESLYEELIIKKKGV